MAGALKERQAAGSPGTFSRVEVKTKEATYPDWRTCVGLNIKKKRVCGGSPVLDLRVLGQNTRMVLKSHLFYLVCYFLLNICLLTLERERK